MTRQQEWATRAAAAVQAVKDNDKVITRFKSLPNFLTQSGAIQTLVFLKGKDEYRPAAEKLAEVYGTTVDQLKNELQTCDLPRYLSMSRDLTECAIWLRRFAQALPDPDNK